MNSWHGTMSVTIGEVSTDVVATGEAVVDILVADVATAEGAVVADVCHICVEVAYVAEVYSLVVIGAVVVVVKTGT